MLKISLIVISLHFALFFASHAGDDFFDDDAVVSEDISLKQTYNDPFESVNRKTLKILIFADKAVLKPISNLYAQLPPYVQGGILNSASNLQEPIHFLNNTIMLDHVGVSHNLHRFVTNSIFGLFGVFDIATSFDVPKHNRALPDVLRYYKAPEGPFLITPVSFGSAIELSQNLQYIGISASLQSQEGLSRLNLYQSMAMLVSARYRNGYFIDEVYKNSIDPYVAIREFYYSSLKNKKVAKFAQPKYNNYADICNNGYIFN